VFGVVQESFFVEHQGRANNPIHQLQTKGFPLIGVILLALGIFKLLQGEDWCSG
jgi:hypothetical protein